jgi:hypothetical protein
MIGPKPQESNSQSLAMIGSRGGKVSRQGFVKDPVHYLGNDKPRGRKW